MAPESDAAGAAGRRWRVGITDRTAPPFDLERRGFRDQAEFVFFDCAEEAALPAEELRKLDALLIWSPTLGEATVRQLERCKIVVRYGVGYDRIDREALRRAGIAFANNPDYGAGEVAETAVAMILALQRRILLHDWRARGYRESWQGNLIRPTRRIGETTVGLIGVGRIGGSACQLLRGLGFRVIGYDPYLAAGYEKVLRFERVQELAELVEQADVISLHCPLTEETRGLADDAFIAAMKPGSILVNTARGQLLSGLAGLERALRSGQLFGAGLDVLPEEPPPDHPLIRAWRDGESWLQGRLLINPHNAFFSDEAWDELRYKAAETAWLYLAKGRLRNAIAEPPSAPLSHKI